MVEYQESRCASRPEELNPARYYEQTPEQRRLQEQRMALRARTKWDFQLKLNDPHRPSQLEDPAVTRWMYARSHNIYPNFRPTPKVALKGLFWAVVPFFFFYTIITRDRENREKLIREGKYERPFSLSS